MPVTKAVVLAAGLGSRMRAESPDVVLDEAQREMADRGLKALIPFHGHPYLSYVLSALADAGIKEVCLVVSPGESPVRTYYDKLPRKRLKITFAIQERPLGSADALLAAEDFAGKDRFLVINADNYYPPSVLESISRAEGSAMVGFKRENLVARGNIAAERVAGYALVTTDPRGFLREIVEKPRREESTRLGEGAWVSMTCWCFGPSIFRAAGDVDRSPRGEYELPDAVRVAIAAGEPIRLIPSDEAVLDLSSRGDVPSVAAFLESVEVAL